MKKWIILSILLLLGTLAPLSPQVWAQMRERSPSSRAQLVIQEVDETFRSVRIAVRNVGLTASGSTQVKVRVHAKGRLLTVLEGSFPSIPAGQTRSVVLFARTVRLDQPELRLDVHYASSQVLLERNDPNKAFTVVHSR